MAASADAGAGALRIVLGRRHGARARERCVWEFPLSTFIQTAHFWEKTYQKRKYRKQQQEECEGESFKKNPTSVGGDEEGKTENVCDKRNLHLYKRPVASRGMSIQGPFNTTTIHAPQLVSFIVRHQCKSTYSSLGQASS